MMDLDRFKEVNDSLGHHAGDELLKELGDRLQERPARLRHVARLGGDEFGLLLPKHDKPDDVIPALDKICEALEQPIVLQELPLAIEASIGVALFPDDGEDVDTLLQHADVAMYAAKDGNLPYAFYDGRRDTYDPARLTIVGELRRAIEQHELVLYYQPKAMLASGEVSSVEALLRWNHPTRGLDHARRLHPARPADRPDQATHALRCRARRSSSAARWQRRGPQALGRRQPLDAKPARPGVPRTGRRPARASGASIPTLLEFEITESTMLADPVRTKLILDKLSSMGIRLAIDDFGTGYSSLAYLKRLPVDEIKIDRSFVMHMSDDDDNATIVRSTIDLGRNLGLQVVAEGVETEEIWDTPQRARLHDRPGLLPQPSRAPGRAAHVAAGPHAGGRGDFRPAGASSKHRGSRARSLIGGGWAAGVPGLRRLHSRLEDATRVLDQHLVDLRLRHAGIEQRGQDRP